MRKKIDYKKLSKANEKLAKEYKKYRDNLIKENKELRGNFNSYLYDVAEDVITLLKDEKDKKRIKKLLGILAGVKHEVFENWLKIYMPNDKQTLFDMIDYLAENKEVVRVVLK